MAHPVQCKCGTIKGEIADGNTHNHLICYCRDCRAFARYFTQHTDILDQHGGTEIVQISRSRLSFSEGQDQLAAIRLSDKGLIRWYAACCATPIGNTLPDAKMAFIGMIHCCLDHNRLALDFGEDIARVHTQSALGEPKPKTQGLVGTVIRMVKILAFGLIRAEHKKSVLFDGSGNPHVQPRILSAAEVAALKNMDKQVS